MSTSSTVSDSPVPYILGMSTTAPDDELELLESVSPRRKNVCELPNVWSDSVTGEIVISTESIVSTALAEVASSPPVSVTE